LTNNEHQKRRAIIVISAFCAVIAVFGISYWVGINLGTDSKKTPATNKVVDSSNKNTEEVYKGKDSLDENHNLDKADTLDKDGTVSYEENKNIGEELDNTKSKEDQHSKDDTLSMLSEKEKWDIYNEGNRLYKQGNYKEALPKLKVAYEIKPDLDLMPWITYQLGNCYKELNDNANALVFFRKVIENYPSSQYVSSSERMINQIEGR
jgi:tetratricopeptide (TPR) repeat protein